ncbi:MAG: enoyl-CoA hydratase [Armatimonadetes bacterium]|nr:enoyl-CoA hydratase [Armatimonadota bacterium]
MTYENILTAIDGHVATIQLNRPKVLNALNQRTMEEIAAALDAFEADAKVRVVILTGDERAFAAGADINEFAGKTAVEMLEGYRFAQWERIRKFPKPIIAAVSGFCLGGGCELAMTCDIILATETARFGQPEINLGIMPGAGGTQRLPRLVGKGRAMEMILTGRHLSATEAVAWGLANRVVPAASLMDEARNLAAEIAAKAPVAVRLAKEAVLKSMDTTIELGADHERRLFYLLFATEDRREGVQAFLEKRKPNFQGW